MFRTFIAIPLPEEVRHQISQLQEPIVDVTWVPPENYHITLCFIGTINGLQVQDVMDALYYLNMSGFDIALQGVGSFGRGLKQSLWVGVQECSALTRLQSKIARQLQQLSLHTDVRKFSPHVTIARLKGVSDGVVASFFQRHNLFTIDPFTVRHYTVYASYPTAQGSVYEPLQEFSLTAK